MSQINIQYIETEYGELILGSYEQTLCLCDWRYRKMRKSVDNRICRLLDAVYVEQDDALLQEVRVQLGQYFNGQRQSFDIPLCLVGTDFQKAVWQQLLEIPYGQTFSYLQLAEHLGDAKSIRAAASANGANGISILVPCHRIIGSDGKLVGYAGGLSTKEKLLKLESCTAGTDKMIQTLDLF